jgi:hypothetical protein
MKNGREIVRTTMRESYQSTAVSIPKRLGVVYRVSTAQRFNFLALSSPECIVDCRAARPEENLGSELMRPDRSNSFICPGISNYDKSDQSVGAPTPQCCDISKRSPLSGSLSR